MSFVSKPTSVKQRCFEDLQVRILTLQIAPGSDLDEVRLSQRYELSRTPLREVLHRLAGDGYVMLANNKGARVASMDLATMRVFFETAPMIYCTIAKLAAEHRTAYQLASLKSVQCSFREALEQDDASGMALFNHRFHQLVGIMARNEYLMPSLERLLIDHTRLGQTFYRPTVVKERETVRLACTQHDAMIAAIESHDVDAVVELTREHWELSRHRMDRYVRPDPLTLDIAEPKELFDEG